MKLPRPAIFFSATAAAVVAVVVFGALLLPRMVDSQAIRDRISAKLAKQFAGRLIIGKIELLWWPQPSVMIDDAEFSFDENNRASFQNLKIYPSIIDLLAARFIVRRALLEGPKVTVRLPQNSKPVDLAELEKQINAGLLLFTQELSGATVDLSNGSAEIRVGDKAPVFLKEIRAQTIASPAALRFHLSGRSSLWHWLTIEGTIAQENLAADLDIGVQRLKLKDSLVFFPVKFFQSAPSAEASLDLKITSVGLRRMKARIGGSAGPVTYTRQGRSATVEIKNLNGAVTYQNNLFQIDVERLDLATPQLRASGQLKIEPDLFSAGVQVRDLDIAKLRDFAPGKADDDIKKILRYIPTGKIPELTVQSTGRSFAEMALSKNIVLSATLRDGKLVLPDPELEFMNVAASVRLVAGMLEAQAITANLGTAKAWNGKLEVGFSRKPSPFHLDIMVHTGAPELHAVLLKLVHEPDAREELLKLRHVEGELSGRLVLGETIEALTPVVAISEAKVTADYQPVPFPIVIRRGRLKYDPAMIQLENAQASVGRSSFDDLDVTWHRDGSREMSVESKRTSLDLRQTDTLLRKFGALSSHLENLKSISGQLNLQRLSLRGAYDDPSRWTFASTGTLTQVEIGHADFPDRVRLARGKFEANEQRIIFSDVLATISDASFSIGGRVEYKPSALTQMDVSGTGTLGARMTQWLSGYADLPEQLSLRTPLDIAETRLTWQAAGDISLHGQATIAGGPRLSVDAVKKPHGLAIPLLSLDDGDRHARFAMQLANDNVDLSFNGELTQEMLDRVFAAFPVKGSSLRGDIQVSATRAEPIRFFGRGEISGNGLWIPLGREQALIEKVSIQAHPDGIMIQSADLRWPKSRLAVSGKITPGKRALQMDLDVKGDQVDWQELQESFGDEATQPKQNRTDTKSFPDIEGTLRLITERFVFERFNFSPLETTVNFSPSGISADIDRGDMCGITAKGRVEIVKAEIGIDLQLSAKDAPLEPSTVCLTNQQNDIKGMYSLTARLAGRGNRRELLRALKGDFELSARNGEFIRSPGIDATFDYLNATGDFKVPFPDLDRETFPYRSLGVKGRIEGNLIIADEVIIDSTLLNLTGQGKVDLERKQIDGKGLIAVLKPVDEVIRRLPVINSLLGGTLVGIPVRINGSLDRPAITYLSPTDIGAELLNIPLRILGMPLGALRLFTPNKDIKDNGK